MAGSPALVVSATGPDGEARTMGLRDAALVIGYRTGADSDDVWLDLRNGTAFEVADVTFTPLTAVQVMAVL